MIEAKESKALLEVREWKAAAWRTVAHLPLREAIRKRLADSAKSVERLGLQYAPAKRTPAVMVAESKGKYGKK